MNYSVSILLFLAIITAGCAPDCDNIVSSSEHFRKSKTIVYVDANASGNNDGTSWENAFTDLQEAIDSEINTEIWVAKGTYFPSRQVNGDSRRHFSFELRNGELYGGFSGTETSFDQRNPERNETVLSGNIGAFNDSSDNCFHVVTGTDLALLVMDGFTITGGYHVDTISQRFGAGLTLENAAGRITNCRFVDNHYDPNLWNWGGGLYAGNCDLEISGCTFDQNRAQYGGALCIDKGQATIESCTFSSNYSLDHGGALYLNDAEVTVNTCRFLHNRSSYGGAVYVFNNGPKADFVNCIFQENEAKTGGAMIADGTTFVIHSTFFHNSTPPPSEMPTCGIHTYSPNSLYLINNILWDRTEEINGSYEINDFAEVYASVIKNFYTHSSVISDDPLFVDPFGGNLSLQPASPAINKGFANRINIVAGQKEYLIELPSTDILGNPRDNEPDLGAIEFGY